MKNMISRNGSISNSESYGWVFEHRPKLKSDSNLQSASLRKITPGNCVFEENNRLAKSSVISEKSLKIWAQKRKKILQEITSARCSLLFDNDLQYPEINYGSWMETMLPRIKQKPLTRAHSAAASSVDRSKHEVRKSLSNIEFSQEMCTRNTSPTKIKRASINRSRKITKSIDSSFLNSFVDDSTQKSLNKKYTKELPNINKSVSHVEKCHKIVEKIPRNEISSNHTLRENETYQIPYGLSGIQCSKEYFNYSKNNLKKEKPEFEDVFDYPSDKSIEKRTKFNFRSVSLNFEPEIKRDLKSFKTFIEEEPACNSQCTTPRTSYLSEEVFSPNEHLRTNVPETLAGEIIPISVRNISASTKNSIPISADELLKSKKDKIIGSELQCEGRITYSEIPLDDVQLRIKDKQIVTNREEILNQELKYEKLQPKTQAEAKLKKLRRSSTAIDSIPFENAHSFHESFTNPAIKSQFSNGKKSKEPGTMEENANTETNVSEIEDKGGIKCRSKRLSAIRYPSIFPGNPIGSDGKTDISNLIVDSDSLVGLNEEELLDRTSRIRQLWKLVEMRSKQRRSMTAF